MRQELRNFVTTFCICNNISISILLQRGTFTSFKLSWSSKIVKLTCRAEVSLTEEQNQWILANQSSSKQGIWPESQRAWDHCQFKNFSGSIGGCRCKCRPRQIIFYFSSLVSTAHYILDEKLKWWDEITIFKKWPKWHHQCNAEPLSTGQGLVLCLRKRSCYDNNTQENSSAEFSDQRQRNCQWWVYVAVPHQLPGG